MAWQTALVTMAMRGFESTLIMKDLGFFHIYFFQKDTIAQTSFMELIYDVQYLRV